MPYCIIMIIIVDMIITASMPVNIIKDKNISFFLSSTLTINQKKKKKYKDQNFLYDADWRRKTTTTHAVAISTRNSYVCLKASIYHHAPSTTTTDCLTFHGSWIVSNKITSNVITSNGCNALIKTLSYISTDCYQQLLQGSLTLMCNCSSISLVFY